MKTFATLIRFALLLLCGCRPSAGEDTRTKPSPQDGNAVAKWRVVVPGVEFGQFPAPLHQAGEMQVVRIDPAKVELILLSASAAGHEPLTADQWTKKHHLLGVINAGMFEKDCATHSGYMKLGEALRPGTVKKDFSSVAAFLPMDKTSPAFRIYDLEDADIFKDIAPHFTAVVQNLRLIKRPRENRWQQQPKKWSEAALGEDSSGHVLLLFSRQPASMHDFNEHVLQLPIDLVAAQHMEGGPEASLYLSKGDFVFAGMGGYETGFSENDSNYTFWALPNVIGIRER
jgi:hypothetical protein